MFPCKYLLFNNIANSYKTPICNFIYCWVVGIMRDRTEVFNERMSLEYGKICNNIGVLTCNNIHTTWMFMMKNKPKTQIKHLLAASYLLWCIHKLISAWITLRKYVVRNIKINLLLKNKATHIVLKIRLS